MAVHWLHLPQCQQSDGLQAFFDLVTMNCPKLVALLGCDCPELTKAIVKLSSFWNIVHVSVPTPPLLCPHPPLLCSHPPLLCPHPPLLCPHPPLLCPHPLSYVPTPLSYVPTPLSYVPTPSLMSPPPLYLSIFHTHTYS